jgi:hypothetical protein
MNKFALTVAALISSCAPVAACGAPGPAVDSRALSFAKELVACVDKSDTREQSHSCRQAVESKYADGGAK